LDQHIITFAKTAPKIIHQFTNYSIKWWNILVYKQPWRTTLSWSTQQVSEGVIVRNVHFSTWVPKQPTPKLTAINWRIIYF